MGYALWYCFWKDPRSKSQGEAPEELARRGII
jgi:hypothetical protein